MKLSTRIRSAPAAIASSSCASVSTSTSTGRPEVFARRTASPTPPTDRLEIVAEGGNLGCPQRGRIEYAQSGSGGISGRINTDAIDNSAGVDTSDHEVNIKILLGMPIADGELTEKQRDALLAAMTGDVAALVLRDNYFQTQSLSVAKRRAVELLDQQERFMRFLEKAGRLSRAIEYLPSDDEIAERRAEKKGLTAPERAREVCAEVIAAFDKVIPLYYDGEDRARGFIEAADRYGTRRRFPILSLSIATVVAAPGRFRQHADLARVAAELKGRAKKLPGSVHLVDDGAGGAAA